MTWKEFKEKVDEQLEGLEIAEDIELEYIDWPTGYIHEDPEVFYSGGIDKISIS